MRSIQGINGFCKILADTHIGLKQVKKADTNISDLVMSWANGVLGRLHLEMEVVGEPINDDSMLFLGNHISYVDIPMLLGSVPRLSFVAKKEVENWPLFGPGAKKIQTVFVKRNNTKSRSSAKLSIQEAIEKGRRVAIFPSGTTSITTRKPWKKGAFEIAEATGCLVQPFRISYTPLREVAYIDKDFFPTHLIRLNTTEDIQARIEFHEPVKITDPVKDCQYWSDWSNSVVIQN